MLSRSAQGLYWMARYLERAAHLCRLMQLQVETLVDRPLREIHFGWNRVYSSMNQSPPAGTLEAFGSDDYTLADSYTLADHLTFEPTNPDSIWNCFAYARANARQVRNYISAEMWLSLNMAYLRLQELDIREIWQATPESFYAGTAEEINTFTGVTDATMYRGDGWHFIQLGTYIERVQLSASVLLSQIGANEREDESFDADWANLLHVFHAFDAYVHTFSVVVQPGQVLDLIVTDGMLPGSVRRSIDMIGAVLGAIGPGPAPRSSEEASELSASLCGLVREGRGGVSEWRGTLDRVDADSRALHQCVVDAYFDYPLGAHTVQ